MARYPKEVLPLDIILRLGDRVQEEHQVHTLEAWSLNVYNSFVTVAMRDYNMGEAMSMLDLDWACLHLVKRLSLTLTELLNSGLQLVLSTKLREERNMCDSQPDEQGQREMMNIWLIFIKLTPVSLYCIKHCTCAQTLCNAMSGQHVCDIASLESR